MTFLLEQKSKSALKFAAYFAKHLIFILESEQNLRFDSKISKFVYVCQNCIKLSPDRLLKFCLNSLISKSLFFEIKLDILVKTRYHLLRSFSSTMKQPFIYFFGFGLPEWFFFYKNSISNAVNSLLECSRQNQTSSIVKKSFPFTSSRQNCFSNLQVCLFNLICAIRSQGQNQTVNVAGLSEVILRAHFSKYPPQQRNANFKKFYSEVFSLFKDVEFAPRSVSLFEVYEHGLMMIAHPRSTSRSEFLKVHDFLEMLFWAEMPLTQINNLLSELDEMIFAVKAASDPINELSKRLDFFLNATDLRALLKKNIATYGIFYQSRDFLLNQASRRVLPRPAAWLSMPAVACHGRSGALRKSTATKEFYKKTDTSQTLPKDPADEKRPESE